MQSDMLIQQQAVHKHSTAYVALHCSICSLPHSRALPRTELTASDKGLGRNVHNSHDVKYRLTKALTTMFRTAVMPYTRGLCVAHLLQPGFMHCNILINIKVACKTTSMEMSKMQCIGARTRRWALQRLQWLVCQSTGSSVRCGILHCSRCCNALTCVL